MGKGGSRRVVVSWREVAARDDEVEVAWRLKGGCHTFRETPNQMWFVCRGWRWRPAARMLVACRGCHTDRGCEGTKPMCVNILLCSLLPSSLSIPFYIFLYI